MAVVGLSGWDWAVFGVTLVASLGTGVFAGWVARRKAKKGDVKSTAAEFLMGGRHLNPFAVALSTMIGAISAVSIIDRDDQPPFPVRRNGTWLPHGSQDSMQPADHGLTPSFEELRTDITNTSCLSTPQLCYSLSDLVKRGCGFINGRIGIHCL
ncbi:hypothetical protein GWK47_007690 [Chionoecetes opilio]|uniref:Uncharacterized protein n=1 Tax=Chionoecetes opilio TaxID=41210 RepID=A0A8J4Y1N7_CHIOP|nr:hypothetical protein GWK47_007690 [Chionoecetes opilio]